MERAAFLIEESGERVPCLLNPASVLVRRVAGVMPRWSLGGPLTGAGLTDAPLIFTGGGWTELRLDLLFDVSLVLGPNPPDSVRDLTGPLWDLAENRPRDGAVGRPPLVRFVWGKSWNVPGVIVAVAERLEYFALTGTPRRSWLRLRMLRVLDRSVAEDTEAAGVPGVGATPAWADWPLDLDERDVQLHDVTGGGGIGDRIELIADQYYGWPTLWKPLAEFNDLDDPLRLEAGATLRVPPIGLRETA